MRRPLNWLVLALSLGFLALGWILKSPQPAPVVVERTGFEARVAIAIPASLRRTPDLEFGYVEQER
jgi:hypothetical protein